MLFRFQIVVGTGVLFLLGMPACVGDDPTVPSATGDASTGDQDGAQSSSEGGQGQDGAACTPGAKVCVDGTTLGTCGSANQTCPFDCSATSGAHCTVMQPSAPVTAADLTTAGAVDLDITVDAFLNTATGAIDNIRPSNDNPATQELKSGIGYRLVGNVGVLTVKTLKVESGATLKLRGASAIAIVASDTMNIIGVVDARAYDSGGALCTTNLAGPGGVVGGLASGAANGSATGAGGAKGAARFTSSTAAPGGGGFGAAGGDGGGYTASGGVSVLMPSPIAGGFGGGASGDTSGNNGGPGGGGGGAVQLVAGTSITIGGGANPGGVNAGGCGGTGGAFGQTGSGGGSGGVILLQSPTITIASSGVLASNGGAGATGNSGPHGGPGQLSGSASLGSAANSGYGKAGDGSSSTILVGGAGGAGTTFGGAGGGAAGRIRLENRSGSVSLPVGAIVSPVIATGASAATTVGALTAK